MKIFSKNVIDNVLNKNFGVNASTDYLVENLPLKNFHLTWQLENYKSKYLHLLMIDYDAVPVCGKPWIHWTVSDVNLSVQTEIKEGESLLNTLNQGITSLAFEKLTEAQKKYVSSYIGPMPPDKSHTYTLLIWTTSHPLNLSKNFYFNEMYKALMNADVVEKTSLELLYVK